MASFVSGLLFLSVLVGGITAAVSQSEPSEPVCYDWGESREGEPVSILEGEAGWLSCPLFFHPSVYNYTSTQSAGHNLVWYRVPEGQHLEQPIPYNRKFNSSGLSRDRDRLWLEPAAAADTGQYICMLRNKSSCSKIAVRLQVLRPDQVPRGLDCEPPVAVKSSEVIIPFQEGKVLDCPDLQETRKFADAEPSVTWYHVKLGGSRCDTYPFFSSRRQQKGSSLHIHIMEEFYQGLYFCRVDFQRRGKTLSFTRSLNVSAVSSTFLPKLPSILHPGKDQLITVKRDSEVRLRCTGLFPYLNSSRDIWWTVDGKTLDKLGDQRFSNTNKLVKYYYGDWTLESVLVIKDFQSEDVNREYNCSVRNEKGFETRRAQLEEDELLPVVELGCGLGVTLLLMLFLLVVYHIFWLELLLLYRSWFGTDERHTDDKEYDVYISYARNSDEEQFVLSTLRSVLENELGYSVCIFDRDSLPGGNLSEAVLHSMQRSRRLVLVLSPNFLAEKSFSLLECRLALYLQHGLRASIVAVVYRSISKLPCVEAAQLRQAAATYVTWRGSRSEPRRSRFWLRLRLALPVRPLALGRRLIDSTSSHSDLAALALLRAQRIQTQRDRANQSRRNRWAPPRGRGRGRRGGTCRQGGGQHATSCSGCSSTGFTGQVEDRGAGLTVETEMQVCVSHDRTKTQPNPIPETEPTPDLTHEPGPSPAPDLDSDPDLASDPDPDPASHPDPDPASHPDSALPTCQQDDGSR